MPRGSRISERPLALAVGLAALVHLVIGVASWTWRTDPRAPEEDTAPLQVRIASAPAPPEPVVEPIETPAPPPPVAPPPPPPAPDANARVEPPPPPPPPEPPPVEPPPEPIQEVAAVEEVEPPEEIPEEPLPPVAAAPQALDAPLEAEIAPSGYDDYVARVGRLIEAKRRYPHAAKRRRLEGEVTVRIAIAIDGTVSNVRALDGASRLFERATLEAVHDAAPFPPPPDGFDEMEVAIRYEIDRY